MARTNVLHHLFADACIENYQQFLNYDQLVKKYTGSGEEDISNLLEAEHSAMIYGVQSIVMAAMCFESAIYDYAAWQLGDNFAKDYLEKLDVLSKWVIVPRMVCGAEIRKDKVPFQKLKNLIKAK